MLDRPTGSAQKSAMIRLLLALLMALAALLPMPLRAQVEDPVWAQDRRLALVAERIMGGNTQLCRQTMPITGLILHSADQYEHPLAGWFANGPLAVAQVLPGSAAELAGIRPGDGVEMIAGQAVDGLAQAAGYPLRDAAFDRIAAAPSPLVLHLRRVGLNEVATVTAPLGCRALVEVLVDDDTIARSDGRVVQISYAMMLMLNDDALAAAFAHELAHAILEHNRRLAEVADRRGSHRYARQAEIEADQLSVHLLANAGYDPLIAPQLWEGDTGRALMSSFLRSRKYPSRRERARLMRKEISEHLATGAGHLLALRDQPWAD